MHHYHAYDINESRSVIAFEFNTDTNEPLPDLKFQAVDTVIETNEGYWYRVEEIDDGDVYVSQILKHDIYPVTITEDTED